MNEIIDATYKFLDELDKSLVIKNIVKYKDKLMSNKNLLKKIKDIKKLKNNEEIILGRKEVYDNSDYKMYMQNYNELYLIVMDINNKYKEYTNVSEHHCKKG